MSLYHDFRKWVKLKLYRGRWEKANRHNGTEMNRVFEAGNVSVGKGTYGTLNAYTFLGDESRLRIGNYCSIAKEVHFITGGEHRMDTLSTFPYREVILHNGTDAFGKGDIVLEDDVWVGFGATILSGVTIHQGAVIAAGALVTKDVPAYAVAGGTPAKVLRYRFRPEVVEFLLTLDYAALTEEMIREYEGDLYRKMDEMSVEEIREQYAWFPKKAGGTKQA